jgi:Sulfate permease family
MAESPATVWNNCNALIGRVMPGLRQLLEYRREWLSIDLVAGVSVAAVAVPTAIAYAQLIGFEPIVGLYAAILPLVAYALFGTSRQLIVNPDAATCAIFAATVLPLAAGDSDALRSLSMALAVLTGHRCGDLPTRLPCRLSRKTDPGRLSQRRGDQHLSRSDWKSVRLLHGI